MTLLSESFGVWSCSGDRRREHDVRIRFDGYAARVVAERRWHPSQEIKRLKEDGGEIEVRLRVTGLEELTRWVLSRGGREKLEA